MRTNYSKNTFIALAVMSDKNYPAGGINKYIEYERRKKLIDAKNLPPREYERQLRKLSDELGV